MTKTATMTKPETFDRQAKAELAELAELYRDMDRRLKNIRKLDADIAKLRTSTRATLDRMKAW
ncbi:hypothetical protein LBMAG56_07610 [Verrucomicrobiota bacterium]|nr:hypothetical protein LBMAG56_07610 [Verrucomicrobiota bacterium]